MNDFLFLLLVFLIGYNIIQYYLIVQKEKDCKKPNVKNKGKNSIRNKNKDVKHVHFKNDIVENEDKILIHNETIRKLDNLLYQFIYLQQWNALLEMGEIYRTGEFQKYVPNDTIARSCFKFASMSDDNVVANNGRSKLFEMRLLPIHRNDRQGDELPVMYGESAIQFAKDKIQEQTGLTRRFIPVARVNAIPQLRPRELPQPIIPVLQNNGIQERLIDHPLPRPPNVVPIGNQNAHDHAVVATMKQNVIKLKDASKGGGTLDINEIKEAWDQSTDISSQEKENATRVLHSATNIKNQSLHVSELEALQFVWDKIKGQGEETKRNLAETLCKQMSSSMEPFGIVCSTGKISRILGTLDGVPGLGVSNNKSMNVVKQELAQLASKTRDYVLGTLNETEIDLYNKGSYDVASNRMKTKFNKEARDTYIKELGLNESILKPILSTYTDEF